MTSKWHSYKSVYGAGKHLFDPRIIISYKYWYNWDVSAAWRLAKDQYNYFSNSCNGYTNKGVISISSKSRIAYVAKNCGVKAGDLIYFSKTGKAKDISHAAIIVKVTGGKIYYAAHTRSRWNTNLYDVIGSQTVFIIRLK